MTDRFKLGKRPLMAAAVGLLLAAAGVTAVASSAAADNQAAAPQVVAQAPAAGIEQVAPGAGTLFFDWGCDGSYTSTSINFAAGGTFTTGDGNAGQWVRIGGTAAGNIAGMLTFIFNAPSRTSYSSVTTSRAATGINTTFAGLNGCHYITQPSLLAGEANADGRTSDGTPVKR
jgi:hypothetical protein